MVRSVLLMFFFMLLLNKDSLQETVQGYVGGSAVFQCNSNAALKDITAHWRYNDSLNVYDIQNGKESFKEQDPVYKGRTKILPEEYMKGNFKLTLSNLRRNDVGAYCCFIPELNNQHCTGLQVTERREGIEEKPSSNRGLESRAEVIFPLFISFFSFTFLLST